MTHREKKTRPNINKQKKNLALGVTTTGHRYYQKSPREDPQQQGKTTERPFDLHRTS